MGINQALAALDETWDEVRQAVAPSVFGEVEGLTLALHYAATAGDANKQRKISYAIAELLSGALAPDHPFIIALEREDTRLVANTADSRPLAERLVSHLSGASAPRAAEPSAEARTVAAEAERWLAQTACVHRRQLRATDIAQSGDVLISFEPDGRLPRFQFDAALHPRPVVLTINAMLDAHGDPWGVADWWLGENAWLGAAPAALLGTVEDDVLVDAAEAELGGM